jgi:hypothetical protein
MGSQGYGNRGAGDIQYYLHGGMTTGDMETAEALTWEN